MKLASALEARRLKRLDSFQISFSRSTVQFEGYSYRPSGSTLAAGDPLGQPDTEFMSSLRAAAESSSDNILDISVTSAPPAGQQSQSNSLSHAVGRKEQHYVPHPTTSRQPLDLAKYDAVQNTKSDRDLPASFEISAVTGLSPDSEGSPTAPGGKPVSSLWGRANRAQMWLGKWSRSSTQDWRSTWWGRTIMWLLSDSTNAAMLTRAVKRFRYEPISSFWSEI